MLRAEQPQLSEAAGSDHRNSDGRDPGYCRSRQTVSIPATQGDAGLSPSRGSASRMLPCRPRWYSSWWTFLPACGHLGTRTVAMRSILCSRVRSPCGTSAWNGPHGFDLHNVTCASRQTAALLTERLDFSLPTARRVPPHCITIEIRPGRVAEDFARPNYTSRAVALRRD